ncbi:MAG: hypothetical protein JJU27_13325 [Gammaproteobacteria bacterium]|nr:hypothetical protein [Gammaproteobacteria bacterium]
MIALGLGISIFGIFIALTAIMVVFMGNTSGAVPALLSPLVLGLPVVAVLGVSVFTRHRDLATPMSALRACPGWLIAALAVLMSVVMIAVLAIWLTVRATGEPLPAQFHLPVFALAAFSVSAGLFSGLLVLREQSGRT